MAAAHARGAKEGDVVTRWSGPDAPESEEPAPTCKLPCLPDDEDMCLPCAVAYWQADEDAIANVRAALPEGETCTDDEAREFLAARGARRGTRPPW
jgi:hypothetical protein